MTMTQRVTRRERERLMRRREILDAARVVFAQKGFNAATLDDVAERAEFGKGTLYNYFPNKEALFISVIEDSFDTVKGIAEDAFAGPGSFADKVEAFVRGELSYFFKNLESVQLMLREAHHVRDGHSMMQLMPQLLAIVAVTVAAEQEQGRVVSDADPADLALMLVNMLFSQFTCRIYRRVHAATGQSPGLCGEGNLTALFAGITPQEIDREIEAGTRLVHTVFFQGVGRGEG